MKAMADWLAARASAGLARAESWFCCAICAKAAARPPDCEPALSVRVSPEIGAEPAEAPAPESGADWVWSERLRSDEARWGRFGWMVLMGR